MSRRREREKEREKTDSTQASNSPIFANFLDRKEREKERQGQGL